MEERREKAGGGEQERDEAAVEIEPRPPRRRQQLEQRTDLDGHERDEQALPGADQRREEEDGELGVHE